MRPRSPGERFVTLRYGGFFARPWRAHDKFRFRLDDHFGCQGKEFAFAGELLTARAEHEADERRNARIGWRAGRAVEIYEKLPRQRIAQCRAVLIGRLIKTART